MKNITSAALEVSKLWRERVALLILLLRVHAQRGGCDLLEVALAGEEHGHGVIVHRGLLGVFLDLVAVDDAGAARLCVLFAHVLELGDDDLLHARGAGENILQILDLVLQGVVSSTRLRIYSLLMLRSLISATILRLHLVDAEADHQVRHHVGLGLRLADDPRWPCRCRAGCCLRPFKRCSLSFFLLHDKVDAAADAFRAPRAPLIEQLAHAHHARHSGDEHVEVAGHGVLQRRGLHQLLHELVGIGAALEVDGQLEAVEVGLVAHIGDLADLARLDELGDLVHDGLGGGGVGDLIDLDEVVPFCRSASGRGPSRRRGPCCKFRAGRRRRR